VVEELVELLHWADPSTATSAADIATGANEVPVLCCRALLNLALIPGLRGALVAAGVVEALGLWQYSGGGGLRW
jgi:hypothetical protein